MGSFALILGSFCLLVNFNLLSPASAVETLIKGSKQVSDSEHGEVIALPVLKKGLWKRYSEADRRNYGQYYDYYFSEPEEANCSQEEFWHIRGLRCVPYECPGGNQYRNMETGECLLKSFNTPNADPRERYNRLNNRMKTVPKFRLPFGLTLKG